MFFTLESSTWNLFSMKHKLYMFSPPSAGLNIDKAIPSPTGSYCFLFSLQKTTALPIFMAEAILSGVLISAPTLLI